MKKKKEFILTRDRYKNIKKMDHQQMQSWIRDTIQKAYDKGRESAEGLGEGEMKELLLSIKGIGEKKAEAIILSMKDAVIKKRGGEK